MIIEQFVMAYGVEQDRIRALLPDEFISLRPVLRINAEIIDGRKGYLEFNTAIQHNCTRGWINIGYWDDILFIKNGETTTFKNEMVEISFTRVGVEGSCPAEKDNAGCYFKINGNYTLKKIELVTANKEFCDCEFRWIFASEGAHGRSIGATIPAFPTEVKKIYPPKEFNVQNAAIIPCDQVLGTYVVEFER